MSSNWFFAAQNPSHAWPDGLKNHYIVLNSIIMMTSIIIMNSIIMMTSIIIMNSIIMMTSIIMMATLLIN